VKFGRKPQKPFLKVSQESFSFQCVSWAYQQSSAIRIIAVKEGSIFVERKNLQWKFRCALTQAGNTSSMKIISSWTLQRIYHRLMTNGRHLHSYSILQQACHYCDFHFSVKQQTKMRCNSLLREISLQKIIWKRERLKQFTWAEEHLHYSVIQSWRKFSKRCMKILKSTHPLKSRWKQPRWSHQRKISSLKHHRWTGWALAFNLFWSRFKMDESRAQCSRGWWKCEALSGCRLETLPLIWFMACLI